MLGYRADPGAHQSTVPMRSENQQVGFTGRVDQNLRGVSLNHLACDDHWLPSASGVFREGLLDSLSQDVVDRTLSGLVHDRNSFWRRGEGRAQFARKRTP
jgi:hypothetical protein